MLNHLWSGTQMSMRNKQYERFSEDIELLSRRHKSDTSLNLATSNSYVVPENKFNDANVK